MKIKTEPEDFIVRECADFPITTEGDYNVYLLEKTSWNTIDALNYLAKKNGVKATQISYGGRKDRHAITTQYITVFKAKLSLETGMKNLKLTYLGKSKKEFSPNEIKANHFTILLRDIKNEETDIVKTALSNISKIGFPNYFGEQRFGSYDSRCGFFAEKFLKAQYNGAVKCALCSIHPQDNKEEKERKNNFFNLWGNFGDCYKFAKTTLEKKVFSILKENPRKFLDAIHQLPISDVSMYFSTYQSFLWNKMIDKLIKNLFQDNVNYLNIKGWYFATFRSATEQQLENLRSLKIPTHGLFPYFVSDDVEKLYDEILKNEGLHQGRFNFRHYRKVIMKSFQREAVINPEGLQIGTFEKDDIYPGKYKVTLSFKLPRGAFATTLIKHIESYF